MNRVLVVVAVVALAIVGWLLFRTEKTDPSNAAPPAGSAEPPHADVTSPGTTGAQPRLPSVHVDTSTPTTPAGSANEYEIGGVRVRDHRSGSNAPMDIPPNIHPPRTRELPSTLTNDVAQKVRAVLADCAQSLPKEARGDHPRLEGQIIVAIKDHKLTVTAATMQLRDVTGDAVATTRQCVEQKSLGLEAAAADQEDLDNYSIGVTFAVL